MSLFKAPQGTIDALEKIRQKFLWGRGNLQNKIHWVDWSKILAPVSDGGLGVGTPKAQNIALVKWWWRPMNEQGSLWKLLYRAFTISIISRRSISQENPLRGCGRTYSELSNT